MTTDTQEELISEEVVQRDLDLQDDVSRAKRTASDAKRRSSEAIAELNQLRWEMTICPLGPRYSERGYADAVGQNDTTIHRGVASWQAYLDANESERIASGEAECSFGNEPHDARPPKLTDKQIKDHDKARRKLDAGKVKAIVIERLAAHWNVVPTTIEVNYREMVNEAVARLGDLHGDLTAMSEADLTDAADALARTMRLEFQEREKRMKDIGKWMAVNRGVDPKDIKPSEIRSMYARIERVMKRKKIDWKEAEAEVRLSDQQDSEAEKISNELARAARMAILDLRRSAADLRRDSMEMIKAVRKIEADEIPLTDDEKTLTEDDLDAAEAAIHLARAALTGNSGTDWDAALASLNEGGTAA